MGWTRCYTKGGQIKGDMVMPKFICSCGDEAFGLTANVKLCNKCRNAKNKPKTKPRIYVEGRRAALGKYRKGLTAMAKITDGIEIKWRSQDANNPRIQQGWIKYTKLANAPRLRFSLIFADNWCQLVIKIRPRKKEIVAIPRCARLYMVGRRHRADGKPIFNNSRTVIDPKTWALPGPCACDPCRMARIIREKFIYYD